MKLKFFLLISALFLTFNSQAQNYRTVCEPDVTTNVAVFGGTASCMGAAIRPFGAKLPPGWPEYHTVSQDFDKMETPATWYQSPFPGFPGQWSYKSPAPVNLENRITENCGAIKLKWKCDFDNCSSDPKVKFSDSCGISVAYACTANIPLISVGSKLIKKGTCHQEPAIVERTVAHIINQQASEPGCSAMSVNGAGGQGWSAQVYKVTCPTDTALYVINKSWSPTGGGFTTCTVSPGTDGYSTSGTCDYFTLNKNKN